ncbi:MAG: SUMF1/EgtB/PvdO family nonheme iron enzyme [Phycisphaerales bacterium]|nr:SUMF1/EgtB/PvdO family nonheme iron enzyme [Phycisphaerales bacterium]
MAAAAITTQPRAVCADIDPLSGVDLVTITHPGNAPWTGNGMPGDRAIGRGLVDYEYRIGRFEVNTAQFVEFFNAAFDRPANDRIPHLIPPTFWGAVSTAPTVPGGLRWAVPVGREMRAVGNIDWRMAAIYCNWLHNGKALNREAFLSGAYEVSTFGYTGPNGNIFTDQAARSPGARYFIPTWDEWLKAAHWDPHQNGPDQPGWWLYPHTSDTPLVYGPPGVGQANAGYITETGAEYLVPLGAYPNVQSPWGLFDVAGATAEWTESVATISDGRNFRVFDGTWWSSSVVNPARSDDWLGNNGGEVPSFSINYYGFRLAAAVPSPSSWMVLGVATLALGLRRRKEQPCGSSSCSCWLAHSEAPVFQCTHSRS